MYIYISLTIHNTVVLSSFCNAFIVIRRQSFPRCHFQLICHSMKEYEDYIYFPYLAYYKVGRTEG